MTLTRFLCGFCVAVLALISYAECKGGRSSGGHSSHSGGHSSGGHSSGGSHSHTSSGGSHTSYGGSHTSYGGESHTSGSGSYSYGGSSGHYASPNHSPGYTHPGSAHPIGFDHVNQNAHGRPGIGFDHVNSQASGHQTFQYRPYDSQTIVRPGGYVQYKPPTSLIYTPATTVHHVSSSYVPVYHPSIIHTQSSNSLDHGSSFLGGYLVGRMSSNDHTTHNHHYNTNDGSGGYYTVHHHHQNRDSVPSQFSVTGEELATCDPAITNDLCVPNTNAFCLKNGTIMCTTPTSLTAPCSLNSTDRCVYSRVPCTPILSCNSSEFYLPCISRVTYVNNRVFDDSFDGMRGSYELCVTAIAHPKALESPFGAVANFLTELGKWHLNELADIHNITNPSDDNNIV